MTMRLLSMLATLRHAASEARNPAAYAVVSAARALAGHRFQKVHDLIDAKYHRQLLRLTDIRDPLRQARLPERYPI
jgi:hypothetical protein